MGEAKRRRQRETAEQAALSPERRLLRRAANHLHTRFIAAYGLAGACHYATFGLHHYLAARHALPLPIQVGYVRCKDVAWATHSWLEFEGRKTDLALHYPNPPLEPGDLLIDGDVVVKGRAAYQYSLVPDDGAPTHTETPDAATRERRLGEHDNFTRLAAAGDLSAIERYLAGAPGNLYTALQRSWAGFAG